MGFARAQLPRRGPAPIRRPKMGQGQIPAPTRGLNQHDSIAAMKPNDALILDNWFCEATYCRVRGGTTSWATGLGAAVQTLMEWSGPASSKFLGCTPTAIFDITTTGAVGAAAVSALGSGYWQHTMFTTAGGSFLVLANGVDSVRNYDGTTWTTPAITVATSSTFNFVCSHKSRLWFVQKDTTKAWYLPTSAIAGAAVAFELGERFKKGGKLVAIGTVSRSGDVTSDDYLAFISSNGEVAIFAGTDPASSTTWGLVGTYAAAAPVGNRSVANVGGDLGILTEAGIVSVQQLMQGGEESAERMSVSNRIDQGVISAFASYGSLTGWQVGNYPRLRMAIFNVPISTTSAFQYVVNTQTGSWSSYGLRASPIAALCWGRFANHPYYGKSDGTVYKAESGNTDSSAAITAEVKTSFQAYGAMGSVDRITMVRPIFSAQGQVIPAVRFDMDYAESRPLTTDEFPLSNIGGGSSWGVGVWSAALWGGSADTAFSNWYAAYGIGNVASFHMLTQTSVIARLNAIDTKYETSTRMAL